MNPTPDQLREQVRTSIYRALAAGSESDDVLDVSTDAALDVVAPVLEAQRQEIQSATEVLDRVREALRQPEDSALSMHAVRVMAELDEARAEVARLQAVVDRLRPLHETPYVDEEHQGGNCVDIIMSAVAESFQLRAEVARLREQADGIRWERDTARADLLAAFADHEVDKLLITTPQLARYAAGEVARLRRESSDLQRQLREERASLQAQINEARDMYISDAQRRFVNDRNGWYREAELDQLEAMAGEEFDRRTQAGASSVRGSVPATPPDWGSANLEECGDPNCRCARPVSSGTTEGQGDG